MILEPSLFYKFFKPVINFFKKTYSWLEKKLLLPLYHKSHNAYLKQHELGSNWYNVDDYFEFSLERKDIFNNITNSRSKLAIRSINNREIKYLDFFIEVSSGNIAYQEKIIAQNFSNKVLIFTLTNIPTLEVQITDRGFYFTYNQLRYHINKIVFKDGEIKESCRSKANHIAFSHSQFLNSSWDRKWGMNWNLDYYKKAEISFSHSIMESLLDSRQINYYQNGANRCSIWGKIKVTLARILLKEKILSKIMWGMLIIRMSYVDDDGILKSKIPIFKVTIWEKILFSKKYPIVYINESKKSQ